jgi:hypothetical protein
MIDQNIQSTLHEEFGSSTQMDKNIPAAANISLGDSATSQQLNIGVGDLRLATTNQQGRLLYLVPEHPFQKFETLMHRSIQDMTVVPRGEVTLYNSLDAHDNDLFNELFSTLEMRTILAETTAVSINNPITSHSELVSMGSPRDQCLIPRGLNITKREYPSTRNAVRHIGPNKIWILRTLAHLFYVCIISMIA